MRFGISEADSFKNPIESIESSRESIEANPESIESSRESMGNAIRAMCASLLWADGFWRRMRVY